LTGILVADIKNQRSRADSSIEAAVRIALQRRPANRGVPNAGAQAKEGVLPSGRIKAWIATIGSGYDGVGPQCQCKDAKRDENDCCERDVSIFHKLNTGGKGQLFQKSEKMFRDPSSGTPYDSVRDMNQAEGRAHVSFATRRSLLSRLKQSDAQESWRQFFDTYWRLIYTTALKAGLIDAEAQEVVQETVLTVFRKIKSFQYDPAVGSFKGWMLTIVRWRIADQFRKRQQHEQPLHPHRGNRDPRYGYGDNRAHC